MTSKKPNRKARSSSGSAKKSTAKKKAAARRPAPEKARVQKKSSAKKSATRKSSTKQAPTKKATAREATAKRTVRKKPARKAKLRRIAPKKPAKPEPQLTVEELPTEELWGLYQVAHSKQAEEDIERLRNILMERHYPLVKYIAERLLQTLPKSIELDDLVSAGLFGLMDAIRGFDQSRGIKFKTYCTTRIRGSILDQLRSQDWVPRLVRLKAGRIEKALQRLTGEYGREPTHAELATSLDMGHGELTKEISSASAKAMYSLSDKWEDRDDDSSMEKVDVLEDKKSVDPIGELNKLDMMKFITRALTHKERFIIEQYYQVGHTMREIGEMLSLTESRVCQIHSNVMARLKSLFGQKQTTLLM